MIHGHVCVNDPYLAFVVFVLGTTPRSMGGTPQRGGGGGTTPGRASVRDKLNINPEESLMEEYEAGYGAKQQQVSIITLITIIQSGDQTCTACLFCFSAYYIQKISLTT